MNVGFKYYPKKLYSKAVKITNFTANMFGFPSEPTEIFYSIKDDIWNDISVWETVSGRVGKLPTVNNDVYIKHVVTCNVTTGVNNLFVSGSLLFSSTFTLTVNGNIQASGTINLSNGSPILALLGAANFIQPSLFNGGASGTVRYGRIGDQEIMILVYFSLSFSGTGTKKLISNLVVPGNISDTIGFGSLNILTFEMGPFDLTVNGTSTITALWSKNGAGNILFIGIVNFGNTSANVLDLTLGNPTVELRGGASSVNQSVATFKTGTGLWTFSTNNQTFTRTASTLSFDCPILISGAITLDLFSNNNATGRFTFNNTVDGNNAASKLLVRSPVWLNNTTMPMATGIFEFDTDSLSILGFVTTAAFTIPYTNFQGLLTSGTGVKTLSGNTTLLTTLTVSGPLELSTFNLTVTGAANINSLLSKTGAGNILFIGLTTFQAAVATLDFSIGNPTVELRGGLTVGQQTVANFKTGTGLWTFSTNNQSLNVGTTAATFDCSILISGAITVTNNGSSYPIFLNTVDGNNAASKLDNRSQIDYKSATMPMVTGLLECNAAANTFKYNKAGNQDVYGTTYRTLEFGDSGAKRLMGNVTVPAATYSVTGTATVDLNGYTLTLT